MKSLHGLVTALIGLLVVFAGAALVRLAMGAGLPPALAGWTAREPLLAAAAGMFLIGLVLLWILTAVAAQTARACVAFRQEGGEVRVEIEAVRTFVARLAAEFPSVTQLRPTVTLRGGRLHMDLICRVRGGTPLPELSRALQARAAEAVRTALGVAEVGPVKVTFREIGAPPARPEEPRARPPVHGAQVMEAGGDTGEDARV